MIIEIKFFKLYILIIIFGDHSFFSSFEIPPVNLFARIFVDVVEIEVLVD